ncbi:hypothetical protein OSTOST_07563 [Ostertagia ostertagi]
MQRDLFGKGHGQRSNKGGRNDAPFSRLGCQLVFGGAPQINAELFELSPDGTKWLMVDSRMMYISVYRNEADRVRIAAVSQTGRTALDTVLRQRSKSREDQRLLCVLAECGWTNPRGEYVDSQGCCTVSHPYGSIDHPDHYDGPTQRNRSGIPRD